MTRTLRATSDRTRLPKGVWTRRSDGSRPRRCGQPAPRPPPPLSSPPPCCARRHHAARRVVAAGVNGQQEQRSPRNRLPPPLSARTGVAAPCARKAPSGSAPAPGRSRGDAPASRGGVDTCCGSSPRTLARSVVVPVARLPTWIAATFAVGQVQRAVLSRRRVRQQDEAAGGRSLGGARRRAATGTRSGSPALPSVA